MLRPERFLLDRQKPFHEPYTQGGSRLKVKQSVEFQKPFASFQAVNPTAGVCEF